MILPFPKTRKPPFIKGAFLVAISFLCLSFPLEGVRNRYYDDTNSSALKEMRDTIQDVRHEVRNHEAEIRTFDEKLKNIDTIIDSLRDHIADYSQSHKESLKGSADSLETKILSLEHTAKDLADDLRQLKTHANDSSTVLSQHNQKIGELEKIVNLQNRNLEHLQAAMQSLMGALQDTSVVPTDKVTVAEKPAKATTLSSSDRVYVVKSGDSLEKIAKRNQTTIQAIKELNGLTNDLIIVGKKLKLPEEP